MGNMIENIAFSTDPIPPFPLELYIQTGGRKEKDNRKMIMMLFFLAHMYAPPQTLDEKENQRIIIYLCSHHAALRDKDKDRARRYCM